MISKTQIEGYTIRYAEGKDIPLIFQFIKDLASYENLLHEVTATEDGLREVMFERKIAEAIIGEFQGQPVGFALIYYSLSTFIGRPAVYIEDLYVKPEYRGRGFGRALFSFLANMAKEKNCWGLEWACLDWNKPSIKFYKALGAVSRDEWTIYRLRGKDLDRLAEDGQ